jgi:hypothetical protein
MTTWTPKTKQSETWTAISTENRPRVFSPLVFAAWPVFATGVLSDFWTDKTAQSETWTPA